jgi:hypothetical protein
MASDGKMMVVLLVEVNKRPTNEIEGDGWKPSDRAVAAEVQDVMSNYDLGYGYIYGMVQVWPHLPIEDIEKVAYLLQQYADSREGVLMGHELDAERLAKAIRKQLA